MPLCFSRKKKQLLLFLKRMAESLNLEYTSVMVDHITVHSSLEAVGLTAAFSESLSQETSVAM
jgi:hypothetical protein